MDLLEAMGLNSTGSLVRGQNASVQVDGGARLTSTSNTFDESLTGIADFPSTPIRRLADGHGVE